VTRIVTQRLEAGLGQPIVVENKPGANSIVGADMVAHSAPDGYTALTVIAAHAANATLYAGKTSFDPVKSFAPISLVGVAPLILTVNNDFPAKDMKQLIEYARANPGKVSFGSSGIGAAAHLTTELLKQTAQIDMLHVPYKGTAPALAALLGGEIQVLVDVPSSMMPHVRAGKVRALALFSSKRSPGCGRGSDHRGSRRPADRELDLGHVPRAGEHAARYRGAPVRGNGEGSRGAGYPRALRAAGRGARRRHARRRRTLPRR
jgi:tripartite-type tricarboxylate transporter receptor subunit TctC